MSQDKPIVEAKEVNIRDLLNGKFFRIPLYQRPFSWNEENFQELVDDILDSLVSEQKSYFIGSIILKAESDGITFEIVDGQQRLTSLIVLLAVFRDYFNNSLHKWVMQEGDDYAGIPSRERITVWDDLQDVFMRYVYQPGGTKNSLKILKQVESQLQTKILLSTICMRQYGHLKTLWRAWMKRVPANS